MSGHLLHRLGLSALCGLLVTAGVSAAEWRQFRGTDTSGVTEGIAPPTSLGEETVAWKVPLPGRGLSGPIVVSNRVYLTASSGAQQDRLHVLCFAQDTGKKLWQRQFWATGRTMCHDKMAVATPQPCSDGQRIFAFYSSNDVACFDLDGNLQWFRGLTLDYPNASNSLGMSSSPVVAGDTLVVQVENDSESFAAGLDVATGVQRWKLDRPKMSNWTSPSVVQVGGKELVLLQSGAGLSAVEPQTGNRVWTYDQGCSTIPSTGVAGNILLVPSFGLTALKFDGTSQTPEKLWNESKLSPGTSSPLAFDNDVYTINRAGVITSAAIETGKTQWQLRLKGQYSATPITAGGLIYTINEEGYFAVVKPGETKGEIVGEGQFGETILCTPAIADGALYVRSDGHLWKVAAK